MNLNILKPRLALNKAFLKVKPNRNEIELFKANLIKLIDRINESETEEFHKNLVSSFLTNTYYDANHFINTKGRNDLVIHNGKDAKSSVGVIIEAKKPTNKAEMIKKENINAKAFQELVLYYLRERITQKNLEIKFLIATNIYEWFIFDAQVFEKLFAQNKELVKKFTDFEEGRLSGNTTDFFYKEIAMPAIAAITSEIAFAHFDIRDYENPLRNNDKQDDNELIALYKLLSPENLLKLPFANDSNSLDKTFYSELLHIIGLTETKDGSKKLIERKKDGERNSASLIESAIEQLDSLDKIAMLDKPHQFGANNQERLFNVALELAITWINRILFLKLLEAQLIKYHKGNKEYSFLNLAKVKNYDDLNSLFFSVLAKTPADRNDRVRTKFANVPYLNSSLFEPTEIEQKCIFISNLNDEHIPVISSTVLKDTNGNKRTGSMPVIDYIFEFLEAYDFASEGSEDIQEDNKRLINASVLGLIFEKINGYKDGSFFTPGFITMYMCRETIRRAVLQKFNEIKNWNCTDFNELYDKIEDRKEANKIVNDLKICDPAVGSGHFLVSALNEIISVKSELKILTDRGGKRLKEYHVEVANDELIITDEDGKIFEYNPNSKESQRVQEALFHEKQTIIESCLFGVDINPNSVKICRLRLWIELLKNAYYKDDLAPTLSKGEGVWTPHPSPLPQGEGVWNPHPSPLPQGEGVWNPSPEGKGRVRASLETLPNIDINIKCGNSLISRYALDADIKAALKKSKWSIDSYKLAVMSYRNAQSKEEKRAMEKLIEQIKSDFESEVAANDKRLLKLNKLRAELMTLTEQTGLFAMTKAESARWEKDVKAKTLEIDKLEKELEEIKNNKIYENAFEWRFEFPEVLNDEGDFIGFDVVIGNPPYIRQELFSEIKYYLQTAYFIFTSVSDLYVYFVELGFNILKAKGEFCYIMPNKWMQSNYGKPLRSYFLQNKLHSIVDFGDLQVFEEATTYPCIINICKDSPTEIFHAINIKTLEHVKYFEEYCLSQKEELLIAKLNGGTWVISSSQEQTLLNKIKQNSTTLSDYLGQKSYRGVLTGLSEAFVIDTETKNKLVQEDIKFDELASTAHYGVKTGLTKAFTLDEQTKNKLINEDSCSIDLLKPMLRGRDIKPWLSKSENSFLITTFPCKRIDIEKYPAIKDYLLKFGIKRLEQSGNNGARKKTGNKWFETQDNIAYWQEFEKPKIMYQVFQVKPCFIYDDSGLYCNNSMWIIPKDDKALLGLLNSKMGWWLISKYCSAIQNGYQLIWNYFSQIRIPNDFLEQSKPIAMLVNQILSLKQAKPQADTSALEKEIDKLVYELYGLTEEEIRVVEGE